MGVIANKVKSGITNGVTCDCVSLLITLAFQVEEFMNIAGLLVSKGSWRERDPYHTKLNKLTKRVDLTVDPRDQPYATLETLEQVRDQMAHAKPINTLIAALSDEEAFRAISPTWYAQFRPKFASEAYDHVRDFTDTVIKAAQLKTSALLSSVGNVG